MVVQDSAILSTFLSVVVTLCIVWFGGSVQELDEDEFVDVYPEGLAEDASSDGSADDSTVVELEETTLP